MAARLLRVRTGRRVDDQQTCEERVERLGLLADGFGWFQLGRHGGVLARTAKKVEQAVGPRGMVPLTLERGDAVRLSDGKPKREGEGAYN